MALQPLPNGPVSPITKLDRLRLTPVAQCTPAGELSVRGSLRFNSLFFETMAPISPFRRQRNTHLSDYIDAYPRLSSHRPGCESSQHRPHSTAVTAHVQVPRNSGRMCLS